MFTVFFNAYGMNSYTTVTAQTAQEAVDFIQRMGYKPVAVKEGKSGFYTDKDMIK